MQHDLATILPLAWRAAPAQTRDTTLKVSMVQNRVDSSVSFTAITAELEGFTGSDVKEARGHFRGGALRARAYFSMSQPLKY